MWDKFKKKLDLPESYISITLGFLVVLVAGILTYNYFVKNQVKKVQENQTKAEEQQQIGKVELPTTYTIQTGDTLWSIALKHYDSGYNWVTIASANNLADPDRLLVGEKLSIPKAETIKPAGDILSTQAPPKEYTVTRDDSLWKIAE